MSNTNPHEKNEREYRCDGMGKTCVRIHISSNTLSKAIDVI